VQPHTDPYDVLIVQTHGHKHWTICTPQPVAARNLTNCSDACKAQLQEQEIHHAQGCTSYRARDLRKMSCEQVLLEVGDVLYMPKGIVHMAQTDAITDSAHITLSLERQGHRWVDVLDRVCSRVTQAKTTTECRELLNVIAAVNLDAPALVWQDLVTAPLHGSTRVSSKETLCDGLQYLIGGDHPASLVNLLRTRPVQRSNSYDLTAQQLLAVLPSREACMQRKLTYLFALESRSTELERTRRASWWQAPCIAAQTCQGHSCDCDDGDLSFFLLAFMD